MAISTSEMFLVIRMRDEVSRAIGNMSGSFNNLNKETKQAAQNYLRQGKALTTVGIAMTGMGIAGIVALEKLSSGAREYEKAAASALTQADGLNINLQQMKDLGYEVASEIPIAFEQIQPALYDIFSSIDVNMGQARKLIKQFAKDAVAGNTDLQTATRASIQILNAFKVPVKDVSKVSDFMFQMVRKGVGDYDALSKALGKGIPFAAKAGQTYQELGAMLSFTTRNGMTAAQAGTSAARAMEAITRPQAIGRLEDMGVAVKNSAGEFRPMSKIMGDLKDKMKDFTKPQIAKALHDIFKGAGGSFRAQKFFALAIEDMSEYQKHVVWMNNANKAAAQAYDIMADTSASAVERAKNAWKILQSQLGDVYNVIRDKIFNAFAGLVKHFTDLSPKVKKAIIYFTLIASALAIVFGVITTVVGMFMLLKAVMLIVGTSMGAVIGTMLTIFAVVAVIALVVAAIVQLYKRSEKFRDVVHTVIDTVKKAFSSLWDRTKPILKSMGDWFAEKIPQALDKLVVAFDWLYDTVADAHDKIKDMIDYIKDHKKIFKTVAGLITVILLPAFVKMGVQAVISAVKVVGAWLLMKAKAILNTAIIAAQLAINVAKWIWQGVVAVASAWVTVGAWVLMAAKAVAKTAIIVAQFVIQVAKWIWMGGVALAQGARVVAGWVLTSAGAIAATTITVAQFTIQKAGWLRMAAVAMASALRVAAAWVISMGPIAIVIAAVAFAVFMIIKYWDDIKKGIKKAWEWLKGNVFTPIGHFFTKTLPGWVGSGADMVVRLWNSIKRPFIAVWNWLKTNVFNPIKNFVTVTIPKAFRLGVTKIKSAWDRVMGIVKSPFTWMKTNVFDKLAHLIKTTIPKAFGSGAKAIGKAWKKVENLAKGPANFVINTVYTKGIKFLWDKVATKFGAKKMPKVKGLRDGGNAMGRVRGAGTSRSDSILAKLSNMEHVWSAREVAQSGGHKGMEMMRAAARKGQLGNLMQHGGGVPTFKGGGWLGKVGGALKSGAKYIGGKASDVGGALKDAAKVLTNPIGWIMGKIKGKLSQMGSSPFSGMMKKMPKKLLTSIKDGIFKQLGIGGMGGIPGGPIGNWKAGDGQRVRTHGVTLDRFTAQRLGLAEKMAGFLFNVTQGSFSTRVAASGSTHSGGGALDVVGGPLGLINAALRKAGFASWIRNPSQGPWPYHVHGIALGDMLAAASAKGQMGSFMRGGTGLARGFDSGGILPPGNTFAVNKTGGNEYVYNKKQREDLINGRGAVIEELNVYVENLDDVNDLKDFINMLNKEQSMARVEQRKSERSGAVDN